MEKTKVGILFGGRSAEHEVALQSAKNIITAIDKTKYELVLIGMDKSGSMYLYQQEEFLLNADNPAEITLKKSEDKLAVIPGQGAKKLYTLKQEEFISGIDVIFPVLHGPYGEDGSIQGLLEVLDIPYVGANVLGSAVGMDKDIMKRLLRDAKLPISEFLVYRKQEEIEFNLVKKKLGLPLFVKPANLGSSVGVSRVDNQSDFSDAVAEAFKFDDKIIIEEYIAGREVECAVLGNDDLKASKIGEILAAQDFYSYEAKYIDKDGARLEIPAKLTSSEEQKIQEIAVATFKVLCCQGLARVDVFLQDDGEVVVNEINTLPGFTKISMYPKLWEISGIPYSNLIDQLIELALKS